MGEQPLPKHGACCLASLNLSEFIVNPYTSNAYFDSSSFVSAVHTAIKALDELIDENYKRHPLKEQQDMSYNYRNIGLGMFGYATALMKMSMTYGEEQAITFTDQVFGLMFRAAVIESNILAKTRGCYPKYNDVVFDSDIMREHFTDDEINGMRQYGLRNCSLLSIAPNGSLATLLNESGGCEPEYAIKYTRRTVGMTDGEDKYYDVYCKAAREYKGLYNTEYLPRWFVGSADIPWINRVKTQAIMQKHIDTAISSTVNLPQDATKEDVAGIYLEAWKNGLKGITIFRDGCKKLGILTTTKDTNTEKQQKNIQEITEKQLNRGDWKPKAADTVYYQRKLKTGCGKLNLFIGWSDSEQQIQDFYVKKSSEAGCERLTEAVAISMSAILRLGGSLDNIEKALKGSGVCPSFARERAKGKKLSRGSSCGVAIFNEIKDFYNEKKVNCQDDNLPTEKKFTEKPIVKVKKNDEKIEDNGIECPECHKKTLRYEGGCNVCTNCGYSSCG